jgi:hypothetical protein
MLRASLRLILPTVLSAALALPAPRQVPDGNPCPPRIRYARELPQLRKLVKPIAFDRFIDPKTGAADPEMTFQEALEHLDDSYDLTFDVNEQAFQAEGIKDILAVKVAARPFPSSMHATGDTVLRALLARVPVPSGITYVVRHDCVEITTGLFAQAETEQLRRRAENVLWRVAGGGFPREDIVDMRVGAAELNAALTDRLVLPATPKNARLRRK